MAEHNGNSKKHADILAGVEVMLSGVRGIPDHFKQGASLADGVADQLKHNVKRITLCGLGGSAFPGELLKVATDPLNIPFSVSRDYEVQGAHFTQEDLVIASSFSGNTEESLSALEHAREVGAQIIVVCAGGKMAAYAQEHQLPLIQLTKPTPTFQPRAATGFFVGALSALLEDLGFFPDARTRMIAVGEELRGMMDIKAQAQDIAKALKGKIPVFYAAPPFATSLARVVKIKINENAKNPAFWNEVPEFNHNEMVGYTQNHEALIAVFLTYDHNLPRNKTRIQRSIERLDAHGVSTLSVPIPLAEDRLSSLFATLYLFDVASCELAISLGIDPNPVEMVEDFKASLGEFQGRDKA